LFLALQKGVFPDLLATSGDYLRVWRVTSETETRLECLLNNVCDYLYVCLMLQLLFSLIYKYFAVFTVVAWAENDSRHN